MLGEASIPVSRGGSRGRDSSIGSTLLAFFLIILLFVSTGLSPAHAWTQRTNRSETFAGYLVDYSGVTGFKVNDILAYWTVPTIPVSQNSSIVLESIGTDLQSNTGFEIGTSQSSVNGTTHYRAFYAIYPQAQASGPTIITSLKGEVGPGMIVGAEIGRGPTNGTWTVTLLTMTGMFNLLDIFSTSFIDPTPGLTAQYSVERLSDYPLANFTSVVFLEANATINQQDFMLNDVRNIKVNMADKTSGCTLAAPSGTTPSAPAFTVSFLRSTASCPAVTPAGNTQNNNTSNLPIAPLDLRVPFLVGASLVAGLFLSIGVLILTSSVPTFRKRGRSTGRNKTAVSSCAKCGTGLHLGAEYCDKCGTPTGKPAVSPS